jgi:hypothetical protein
MCKEEWASAVLRFSFALLFLVLCFSFPVSSLVLCLLLHHLAPARTGQKRLPLHTTKARTTNEFAFQSPFALRVPGPEIEQGGYWKFDVGTSIVRIYSPLFLPAMVKLFTDLWDKRQVGFQANLTCRVARLPGNTFATAFRTGPQQWGR